MFLQSDGGRNDKEWEAIKINRKMFDEEVDWECKVYKIYESKNNGLYAMSDKVRKLIWENVDRCIFLEDDYVPSVSYFEFCREMLERYKDDLRVHYVTGYNYMGVYDKPDSDYFFCGEGSIWGCATWKRVEEERETDYRDNPYALECIMNVAKHYKKGYEKLIYGYAKNDKFGGHIPGTEFYKNYLRFSQNHLLIVPKKELNKKYWNRARRCSQF